MWGIVDSEERRVLRKQNINIGISLIFKIELVIFSKVIQILNPSNLLLISSNFSLNLINSFQFSQNFYCICHQIILNFFSNFIKFLYLLEYQSSYLKHFTLGIIFNSIWNFVAFNISLNFLSISLILCIFENFLLLSKF